MSKVSEARAISKKYDVSVLDCIKEKMYLASEKALDKYYKNASKRAEIDYLSELTKEPKGKLLKNMERIRKKYNISVSSYIIKELYKDPSDENYANYCASVEKKSQLQVKSLANIMGISEDEASEYASDIKKKHKVGLITIKNHELFKLDSRQIDELLDSLHQEDERLKKTIFDETGWTEYEFAKHRLTCKHRYGIVPLELYYNLECYRVPFKVLETYATKKISSALARKYNCAEAKSILGDKVTFANEYKEFLNRKFWTNRDTSMEEFIEFTQGLTQVFCKPINLMGGHGCYAYDLSGNNEQDYEYFMSQPLMLVEEIPKQHSLINEFYSKCINTVRFVTIQKDGKVYNLASWIKFGANGSVIDGRASGGNFAGVDENTGIIITDALDGNNNRLSVHPDSGKVYKGFQIPYWKESLELVTKAMKHIEGINYVGWDVCITEDGPVIIEGNSLPMIVSHQLLFSDKREGMKYKYEPFL